MWEIDNLFQLLSFLYAAAFGGGCCLFYDVFRLLRKIRNAGTWEVFLQDILYACVCAVFCFCFFLAVTGGDFRLYAGIGIGAGFVLTRMTVSRILFPPLARALTATVRGVKRAIGVRDRFLDDFEKKCTHLGQKGWLFCKKHAKPLKKLLKKK